MLQMLFFLHTMQMAMLIYERYPCHDTVSMLLILVQLSAIVAITISMANIINMWHVIALPLCNTWILFILSAYYQAFITIPYAFILVLTLATVRFNRARHIELISRHDQI